MFHCTIDSILVIGCIAGCIAFNDVRTGEGGVLGFDLERDTEKRTYIKGFYLTFCDLNPEYDNLSHVSRIIARKKRPCSTAHHGMALYM